MREWNDETKGEGESLQNDAQKETIHLLLKPFSSFDHLSDAVKQGTKTDGLRERYQMRKR